MREALTVTTIALCAYVEKEDLFPVHCLTLLTSTPSLTRKTVKEKKKKEKKVLL